MERVDDILLSSHVKRHPCRADRLTGSVGEYGAPTFDRMHAAIGPDRSVVQAVGTGVGQGFFNQGDALGAIVGMEGSHPVVKRPAKSSGRKAVHGLESLIPGRRARCHVPRPAPEIGSLDGQSESLLSPQCNSRVDD